jgi:hypothetical protein
MLAYATSHGQQPIPLSPDYVHLLNQADEFRSGSRLLRISGMWDLAWGFAVAMVAMVVLAVSASGRWGIGGPLPFWVGAGWAVAGMVLALLLVGSGLWLVLKPTPLAMIVDGCSLVLLAAGNGAWFAYDRMRGGAGVNKGGWLWIAVFAICLFSGIGRFVRYRKFRDAARTAPPKQTLLWLNDLRKNLRKIKPEQDVTRSTFRFDSTSAWPPVLCRGRMTPQMLMCLINNERVQFYRKSDFRIEPVAEKAGEPFVPPLDARKKVKAKITLGERTFNALMPYESLARLEGWQEPAPSTAMNVAAATVAAAAAPGSIPATPGGGSSAT